MGLREIGRKMMENMDQNTHQRMNQKDIKVIRPKMSQKVTNMNHQRTVKEIIHQKMSQSMNQKHDEPSKHEPSKDYDNDKHDGKYGTAYSMLGETENASCPSDEDFDMNAPCDYEGRCGFGEESCCGETFVSLMCQCAGTRSFCFYTDACFGAQC